MDEHPRPEATLEAMGKLAAVFKKGGDGTVTAGNASGICDGAAALVIATGEAVKAHGLQPLAKVVGWCVSGGRTGMAAGPEGSCHPAAAGCRVPLLPGPSAHFSAATAANCRPASPRPLPPRRRSVAGVDPSIMGIGPAPAIRQLLAKTGRSLGSVDVIEVRPQWRRGMCAAVRQGGAWNISL